MITAFLVRWAGGWHEVADTDAIAQHGRHEALLGLGALGSLAEVERVARLQLDLFARSRVEIAAEVWPQADTERPYVGYAVGDTIAVPGIGGTLAEERVMAITVAEDDDGVVTYAPELRDVILTQAERLEQALKKMADGTVRGQSSVAQPVGTVNLTVGKDCCPPIGAYALATPARTNPHETVRHELDAPAKAQRLRASGSAANLLGGAVINVHRNDEVVAVVPLEEATDDVWEVDVDLGAIAYGAGERVWLSVEPGPDRASQATDMEVTAILRYRVAVQSGAHTKASMWIELDPTTARPLLWRADDGAEQEAAQGIAASVPGLAQSYVSFVVVEPPLAGPNNRLAFYEADLVLDNRHGELPFRAGLGAFSTAPDWTTDWAWSTDEADIIGSEPRWVGPGEHYELTVPIKPLAQNFFAVARYEGTLMVWIAVPEEFSGRLDVEEVRVDFSGYGADGPLPWTGGAT